MPLIQYNVIERTGCIWTLVNTTSASITAVYEEIRASVWCKRGHTRAQKNYPIMTACCGRFNKQPPRKVMLLDWEKSVFAFGHVRPKDRPRNEGRKTHWTSCAAVDAFVDLTPPTHSLQKPTGNHPQNLVCHGQRCKVTQRNNF